MENGNNIELRSSEVQEILGTPPGWLVQRGITIISLVVVILLAGSYFYKYPDIISAQITILSENPPVTLVARSTGKLDFLFVADQQEIQAGELLGIIENPSFYQDVYKLINNLDSIQPDFETPAQFNQLNLSQELRLGEVQPFYTAFISQYSEYSNFIKYDVIEQRILSLRRQVLDQEKYLVQLINQARILDDKRELSRRQLLRDSALYLKKALPESELEKSGAEYLNQELNHRTVITSMANTRMQINQLQSLINEQQALRSEQSSKLMATLIEKYENLVSQLRLWEQKYVLKSPVNGKVTFTSIWSANQQILSGQTVFSVVPLGTQKIIGRITIPVSGSGKVEIGQRVNVKIENFPFIEYGMLKGLVSTISLVPVNTAAGNFYTAEVKLPEGLVTNYGKTLNFNQEMQGTAEIITRDRRLIERLVDPLVSLFRERMLTN